MHYEEMNQCDIVINKNLDNDADMYIEWGNGIEVAEEATLNFIGNDHWLNNNADIWVYGNFNLGSSNTIQNTGKIQVGGITGQSNEKCMFTNDGVIENSNYIEVLQNGRFINNGTIENRNTIKVQDGEFNGDGIVFASPTSENIGVSGRIVTKIDDYEEMKNALDNDAIINIMISGIIGLEDDLTVNKSISTGSENEYGELQTNGYTITIPLSYELEVDSGCIVINDNGKVINQGDLTVQDNGELRVETGGTLQTDNDITINGYLDLYDYDNRDNYITGPGKIITYADRATFIELAFDAMYSYSENQEGVTIDLSSLANNTNIASPSDVEAKVFEVRNWFVDGIYNYNDNMHRHYAYAAMMLNGIGVNNIAVLYTAKGI